MLKVDYKKRTKEGTLYNQTITIDTATARAFNNYVETIKKQDREKIEREHIETSEQLRRETFLKPLENGVNYGNITTLNTLNLYLIRYTNDSPKRIKARNTIIIVK